MSYNGHGTNRPAPKRETHPVSKKKKSKGSRTVAGVKIPKDIRKKMEPALKLAEHPVVADLLAAGIAAASAAIANSKAARAAARAAGEEASDAAAATAREARKGGDAVKAIALDFARHFIDAYEAGGRAGGSKGDKGKARRKAAADR